MIKSFGDKETESVFYDSRSRKLPSEITAKASKLLDRIEAADTVDFLKLPPSHRLHKLSGELSDFWSVSINMQWRIIFRFEGNDAYDVEIVDYH
jgi:proteic killer suppression protein